MRFQLEYSVITVVQIYLLILAHNLKMATSKGATRKRSQFTYLI